MKPLSIENAYQWVQAFVVREWRLVLPVALAFMALPQLLFEQFHSKAAVAILAEASRSGQAEPMAHALAVVGPQLLLTLLIGTGGGLAITALALIPAISVRDAITTGFRRLPVLLGSYLLIFAAYLAVVVAASVVAMLARMSPLGGQSLTAGLLFGIMLVVGIRLVPLAPLIVRRRIGPIAALRETWLLTEGVYWRILAAVLVYLVAAVVVMLALSAGIGTILILGGKAVGLPELGSALNGVFGTVIGAMVSVGFHLLAVAIFLQLDRSSRGI